MKLSDLVAFRNQLSTLSALSIGRVANHELEKIHHLVESQAVQVGQYQQRLRSQQQTIEQCFLDYETQVEKLKSELNELIIATEQHWFLESYRLYEQEMCRETTEYILARRPVILEQTKITLQARLMSYANWKYPGLIIRPGLEDFIDDMVAFDPLYIVDQNYDLLEPATKRFPDQYRRRLRQYTINEWQPEPVLDKIPNGQFGICLVYNFFEFRPFEVIKKYLIELYAKLKPGGVLIMTFNDCDHSKAVELVEQHYACYTPGYLVKDLAISLGFEVNFSWNDGGSSTWLELHKPGKLTSIRGGQTLAKVIPK
jgi:hypothetical protein